MDSAKLYGAGLEDVRTAAVGARAERAEVDRVARKVYWGLLPLLTVMGVFIYLDRSNLSFISGQIIPALGLTSTDYGLGSGLPYLGYVVANIPSSIIVTHVGAPTWLAALMLAWGVVSACTAAVRTRAQFFCIRVLLGITEAGCFPGAWYHLSLFLDDMQLNFAFACVLAGAATAQVIGGPLASGLLLLDGMHGLYGWQWVFLVEGVATAAFGVVLFFGLPRSPTSAWCLSPAERAALSARRATEREVAERRDPSGGTTARALSDWRNWYIGAAMLLTQCGNVALMYFLPLLLRNALYGPDAAPVPPGALTAGDSHAHELARQASRIALITLALYFATMVSQVVTAWNSKRTNERRWHMTIPLLLGGVALMATEVAFARLGFIPGYLVLIVAGGGLVAYNGPVSSLPATYLHGTARAPAYGIVNSVTAMGGLLGPYLAGALSKNGTDYSTPLLTLGAFVLAAAIMLFAFPTYQRPLDDSVSIAESGEMTPSLSKREASGSLDDVPRRVSSA
ncbi:hypothetical protein WJX81_000610 [Elliptochloris bilobata]|uniref:Major facilitator superfamily (MFS) profile domain-containing protein n=1 Tax=Elliptochloris bilobata TaxID=381761 RepID=A0AAW1RVI5_9CHLO